MDAGDERLCSNGYGWIRDERSAPKRPGGGWKTSGRAQKDMVGSETSDRARENMVEVGDERSGSKGRGWSVRRAIGLEMMWWRQEMSSGD